MPRDNQLRFKKYLLDALDAGQQVHGLTAGKPLAEFVHTPVRWIAERGFEIFAEALKRAVSIEPALTLHNLGEVFATRNKIVHEYDVVDVAVLYSFINDELPTILVELEAKLATL